MENQIFRNHSSFCLRKLATAFFLLLPISIHRLYAQIVLVTFSSIGRARTRGFGPRYGIANPLIRVAKVAANLVVEAVDSQVTEAGRIGAEMVV